MPVKKVLTAGLAGFMMLLLIVDSRSALQSASEGITLCLKTVIPSLFPFLLLSFAITSSLWGESIPFLRRLAKRMDIPKGGESILLSAFLGGYPAGAQMIGSLYQQGHLSRKEAQRLLPLCNNAGPAFLFGLVAMQFPRMEMVVALWLIQIFSIFFTAFFSPGSVKSSISLTEKSTTISEMLNQSVRTMAYICGWIILFRILCEFMDRWFLWYFPQEIQILCKGILELSSGCCELYQIGSPAFRFLICAVMLSFGGICVTMQTASVIGSLSLSRYLRVKLFQTASAAIISVLYLRWGWVCLACVGALILFLPLHQKNNCRFSAVCDV